jgi:hypothetical protein
MHKTIALKHMNMYNCYVSIKNKFIKIKIVPTYKKINKTVSQTIIGSNWWLSVAAQVLQVFWLSGDWKDMQECVIISVIAVNTWKLKSGNANKI